MVDISSAITHRRLPVHLTSVQYDSFKQKLIAGPNGCLFYKGRAGRHGRFTFLFHGEKFSVQAHRLAFVYAKGPVGNDLYVLHNCPGGSAKGCCNGNHLYSGTAQDNADDREREGRTARGSRHGHFKLGLIEKQQLVAAFVAGATRHGLAAEFGVSYPMVTAVIREFGEHEQVGSSAPC